MGDTAHASLVTRGGASFSATARWVSGDTSVLEVSESGTIVAVGDGTATLTAHLSPTTGTAASVQTTTVTVLPAILVGAGDIGVCEKGFGAELTAKLLDSIPGTVFTAGDNTYPVGAAQEWATCWVPTWGRHKARINPALGNHDWETPNALPYFDYFGPRVGERGVGNYSYELGSWHIIVVNSNLDLRPGSLTNKWLEADLNHDNAKCTLAIWHHPRFSSSSEQFSDPSMQPLWELLYKKHADVVVNGHAHTYERFAPQTPNGTPDPSGGIREFVVGTGGALLLPWGKTEKNSEVRFNDTWGVIKFTLSSTSYTWQFVGVPGMSTHTDSGSGQCH
jgi:hypothetical protein